MSIPQTLLQIAAREQQIAHARSTGNAALVASLEAEIGRFRVRIQRLREAGYPEDWDSTNELDDAEEDRKEDDARRKPLGDISNTAHLRGQGMKKSRPRLLYGCGPPPRRPEDFGAHVHRCLYGGAFSEAVLNEFPELRGKKVTDEEREQILDAITDKHTADRHAYLQSLNLPTDSLDPVRAGMPDGSYKTVPKIEAAQMAEERRQKALKDAYDNESGVNKFFRKVNAGLRTVADVGKHFVPWYLSAAYDAFRPSDDAVYGYGQTGGALHGGSGHGRSGRTMTAEQPRHFAPGPFAGDRLRELGNPDEEDDDEDEERLVVPPEPGDAPGGHYSVAVEPARTYVDDEHYGLFQPEIDRHIQEEAQREHLQRRAARRAERAANDETDDEEAMDREEEGAAARDAATRAAYTDNPANIRRTHAQQEAREEKIERERQGAAAKASAAAAEGDDFIEHVPQPGDYRRGYDRTLEQDVDGTLQPRIDDLFADEAEDVDDADAIHTSMLTDERRDLAGYDLARYFERRLMESRMKGRERDWRNLVPLANEVQRARGKRPVQSEEKQAKREAKKTVGLLDDTAKEGDEREAIVLAEPGFNEHRNEVLQREAFLQVQDETAAATNCADLVVCAAANAVTCAAAEAVALRHTKKMRRLKAEKEMTARDKFHSAKAQTQLGVALSVVEGAKRLSGQTPVLPVQIQDRAGAAKRERTTMLALHAAMEHHLPSEWEGIYHIADSEFGGPSFNFPRFIERFPRDVALLHPARQARVRKTFEPLIKAYVDAHPSTAMIPYKGSGLLGGARKRRRDDEPPPPATSVFADPKLTPAGAVLQANLKAQQKATAAVAVWREHTVNYNKAVARFDEIYEANRKIAYPIHKARMSSGGAWKTTIAEREAFQKIDDARVVKETAFLQVAAAKSCAKEAQAESVKALKAAQALGEPQASSNVDIGALIASSGLGKAAPVVVDLTADDPPGHHGEVIDLTAEEGEGLCGGGRGSKRVRAPYGQSLGALPAAASLQRLLEERFDDPHGPANAAKEIERTRRERETAHKRFEIETAKMHSARIRRAQFSRQFRPRISMSGRHDNGEAAAKMSELRSAESVAVFRHEHFFRAKKQADAAHINALKKYARAEASMRAAGEPQASSSLDGFTAAFAAAHKKAADEAAACAVVAKAGLEQSAVSIGAAAAGPLGEVVDLTGDDDVIDLT